MASRAEPGRNGNKGEQKRGQPQQRGQNAQSGQGAQTAQGGEAQRNASEGTEAATDELYGVVSVLYHALQGAQTYTQYVNDARRAGDEELVEFFETCRDEENGRAERAKMLLSERLSDIDDEMDDEDDEDDEEASDDDEA